MTMPHNDWSWRRRIRAAEAEGGLERSSEFGNKPWCSETRTMVLFRMQGCKRRGAAVVTRVDHSASQEEALQGRFMGRWLARRKCHLPDSADAIWHLQH